MLNIRTTGLQDFKARLARAPEVTTRSAVLALNHGARRARTAGKRAISQQVNLTQKYVDQRLRISQYANPVRLQAIVAGRARPTSLVRFNARQLRKGDKNAGVSVRVKRGRSRKLRRAFLIRLRRGKSEISDGFNVGLAIRLKDGEFIENKKVPFDAEGDAGLFLLYGPSVDQVWTTVRDDIQPGLGRDMNAEFNRQFARLY